MTPSQKFTPTFASIHSPSRLVSCSIPRENSIKRNTLSACSNIYDIDYIAIPLIPQVIGFLWIFYFRLNPLVARCLYVVFTSHHDQQSLCINFFRLLVTLTHSNTFYATLVEYAITRSPSLQFFGCYLVLPHLLIFTLMLWSYLDCYLPA